MSNKIKLSVNIVTFLFLTILVTASLPTVTAVHNLQESATTDTGNITDTIDINNETDTTKTSNIIDVNTGSVNFSISDDYSVDVSVSITDFNISLNNLNKDTGVGSIKAEHSAFGKEEARMAKTGICAVGLAGTNVPVGVEDDGYINSDAEPIESPESNSSSDIVEVCTDYD